MVGSLTRIWPWKRTTSYLIRPDGSQLPVVQEPVLPETYYQLTGLDPFLVGAAVSCLAGLMLILVLDRFALLSESEPDWYEGRR